MNFYKVIFYLFIFIFLYFHPSKSQILSDEECGCNTLNVNFLKNKPTDDQLHLLLDSVNFGENKTLYRIPVKFWIYRKSDGKDGFSEEKIKELLYWLNYYHSINNTGLSYYLKPDIRYIDNNRLVKLKYILQAPFQTAFHKSKACINVHIADKLKLKRRNHNSRNLSGTYNAITKGVIIVKGSSISTLTHEIGHYLGLKHPHRFWKSKLLGEPVSRTKEIRGTHIKMCEKKGDGLCDTPAEPNLSRFTDDNCKYTGWNVSDSYGVVYVPNTDNIMSYTKNRECRTQFTKEQIALMLYTASKNKYSKFWEVTDKNTIRFNFDTYEPDNSRNSSTELNFNIKQTHTFHEIFNSPRKETFKDSVDWLFIKCDTTKQSETKIIIAKSDAEFPAMRIRVYNSDGLIYQKEITEPEEIKINTPCKDVLYIQVINIMFKNILGGYSIKLAE